MNRIVLLGCFVVFELNNQERQESKLMGNSGEGSDGSSTGAADFTPVSPSDSMNNLFEPEEELFLSNKKYKQAKNLANQDQSELVDFEAADGKINLQLRDDFQSLNLHQYQAKANVENRNLNLKQKCTSIQKLDKDMENRSKKSNTQSNAGDGEFPEPDSDGTPSPSTSGMFKSETKGSERPSTPAELEEEARTEEVKRGVIKKRPSSATTATRREEHTTGQSSSGLTKLTVGMPVCGNLIAALRNRKKIRNAWTDVSGKIQDLPELNKDGKVEVHVNGSGDNLDADYDVANEEDMIGEDVLVTSQKWRESFRRFRSNNRARWEEEEQEERREEAESRL